MSVRSQPESNAVLGAGYMSLAMLAGAAIDISVKALAGDFSTAQIVFLRSLLALPIVLAICAQQGVVAELLAPRWGWQLYRGLLVAGANFGFFYGLAHVPLVTAYMLGYVSPVLIVILARPMLGERVGVRRWIGIMVAFAGVLVVVQPTTLTISPAELAILGSSACWALLSISNRQLGGQVSTGVLSFYTMPVSALLGGALTVGGWQAPTTVDWWLFLCAGTAGGVAHTLVAIAYRHARAGVVAPFEYTALIWSALAAWLFWQEAPEPRVWVGGVAVIIGGYIALKGRG